MCHQCEMRQADLSLWIWQAGIEEALEQQPDEPSLVKLKNDLTEAGIGSLGSRV